MSLSVAGVWCDAATWLWLGAGPDYTQAAPSRCIEPCCSLLIVCRCLVQTPAHWPATPVKVFGRPSLTGAGLFVALGARLVGPVGAAASGDGTHVFLADPGASRIFAVPSSGGPPVAVAGSDGWAPRGLDVVTGSGGDTIYFSGRDPTDKAPGVLTLPAGGGTPAVVAKGAAFTSPDAVVVAATGGAVYVSDRGNGSAGTVLRVSSTVSTVLDSVRLGDPGGLSLSKDGRA